MESVISLLGGVRNRLHMGLWVLPRPTGGVEAEGKVISANPPASDFPNEKANSKALEKVNCDLIYTNGLIQSHKGLYWGLFNIINTNRGCYLP